MEEKGLGKNADECLFDNQVLNERWKCEPKNNPNKNDVGEKLSLLLCHRFGNGLPYQYKLINASYFGPT